MKLKATIAAKSLLASITLAALGAQAHVTGDPAHDAAGTNRVAISLADDRRVITANGWPDHLPGQFPRRGNPNTLSPQNYTFRMTLHPKVAATPTHDGGWFFAVALNGVPFEPGTGETWDNTLKKLDKNGDGKLTPDEFRPNGAGFGPPPGQK